MTHFPDGWELTRVDRVATVNARIGWKALTASEYQEEGYIFLATPNIKGRAIDFDNVNFISEYRYSESPELSLRVGDVLLVKDGSTLGITALVDHIPAPATVNGSIAIVRPFGVMPAYLCYVLAGGEIQAMISRLRDGMGVPHLFQWDIRRLPVPLPPIAEQRRIADFLDDQTTRIDNIIAARQRQVEVLAESRANTAHHLLDPHGYEGPPLSTVALIVDTAHKTAPDVSGGGYWVAGTSALRDGRIVRAALRETDREGYLGWTERATPREGDVLISREAPVGQVGLIESDLPPIAIGQRVVLVRPLAGLDSKYLRLVLMSPALGRLVYDSVQGSLHPHLNMADISRLRVPLRELTDQQELGIQHANTLDRHDAEVASLRSSIALLQEFKRSLISAAVSGEFDVSTASGRGVPA